MRPFRSARVLVIPALVVPLVLGTLAVSGPAFAKSPTAKSVVACRTVGGTVSNWTLSSCSAPAITGDNSTSITPAFPTTAQLTYQATITWNNGRNGARGGSTPGTTTIKVSASNPTKNKCATGSTEWELVGTISASTGSPTAKGKVKIFACVSNAGVVTNKLKKGNLRAAKL